MHLCFFLDLSQELYENLSRTKNKKYLNGEIHIIR